MRIPLLAASALAALAVLGCSQDSGKTAARKRIAVIPKGTTHEFWKSVHAGAERAAQELGAEVIWKGPLKEDDREAQIKVVEDFITRGVDGIVLMPLDDKALAGPAKDAASQKIPVVVADSDLQWDGRVSFVATDNRKGGKLGGEHLGKTLGGKGKVLMMRYQEGSASTMEREAGFLEAMKEFPGIEVVSSNQYGGATTESAYKTAENLLQSFGDIAGIFCPNESTTFGMLRALQDAGKAGKVKFVGFDSSDKLLEALKKGELQALVLQNPVEMGRLSVKACLDALAGKPVEKRIDTGATVATSENLSDPKVAALLKPDLSILAGK